LSNLARAAVWIGLGLALGAGIGAARGSNAAAEYYAAFFLEESLSIDNIFVFTLIFSELQIPDEYRRRVLRFGVLGALVFRALVIGGGITLINRFSWVTYPFAVIMLFAAWRLVFGQERERRAVEAACNVCQSWVARIVPVSPVLVFTAAKMLTSSLVHISALTSVLVIGSVLLATIAASWFTSERGSSRLA